MDIFVNIYFYIMIFGSLIVGIANLVDVLKGIKNKKQFSKIGWAKWTYIILGFYWSLVYSILVFLPRDQEYIFTSIFIKPSMIVLIFLLLLSNQKPVYLPDLIKDIIVKIKNKGGKKNVEY